MRRLFTVMLITFSLFAFCSCGKKYDSENAFGSEVVSQGMGSEDLSETGPDTQDKENDNVEKIFTQDFDGTVMTIITDKSVYSVGETIYVTASLENTKSEDIYLYYPAATRDGWSDELGNYLVELVVNLENWYKEPQDSFFSDEPFVWIPVKPGEKHVQYYQFQPYPAVVSPTPLGGRVCYPDLKKAAEPGVYNGNFRMRVSDKAEGGTRYTLDYFVTLRAKERTEDASDGMPGDESVVGTEDKKGTSQETEAETVSAKGPITVVSKETSYASDGSVWVRAEYEYDRAGNRTKETRYEAESGSVWVRAEYEYDRAGNLTKMTEYWPDGYLYYREEYEYDGQGKMTKQTDYWADGSLGRWFECEYDNSGNRTKQTEYRADGRLDCWYEYEYDSSGNLTKQTDYSPDGSSGRWYEYEYDSAGNRTKMAEYIAGSLRYWEEYELEYEYDSAGNLTKMTSYDSVGYWKEYEYMTIER